MKIDIGGVGYELAVERAKQLACLVEIPVYPLVAGDVYGVNDPQLSCNPFLLVEATYVSYGENPGRVYQLCGMGVRPNSGTFFQSLHTKEEIEQFLRENGMKYLRNINHDIRSLVNKS
jgi:hypothetical protein